MRAPLLLVLAVTVSTQRGCAIIAPDLSLDTVPIGYFGGNARHRDQPNIDMLAKCRLVMLEKWEGHCWQDCLAQGPGSAPCQPSCDAETSIMDTMRRIKAVNPKVSTVMYLNTLLAFPFYALVGKFQAANALTLDSVTNKPIAIRNDNGMEDIFVWGFDTPKGQQLYLDAIRNYTYSGVVDGFFGDKWNKGATPIDRNRPGGGWEICNKECGNVSAQQGRQWNEGKAKVLKAATKFVGEGPYFSYGWFASGTPEGNVSSNLDGNWQGAPGLKPGTDPRDFIASVEGWLHGTPSSPPHTYVYMNPSSDQHWTTDPNDPASLHGNCVGDCLARFLLGVEPGVILGADGWDESYDKPLGAPLAPAVFTDRTPSNLGATLTRTFSSGTKVVFTYSNITDPEGTMSGTGEIWWGGVKPPPPAPPPALQCGSCRSSLLASIGFAGGELAANVTPSPSSCCDLCAKTGATCAKWTWHADPQGHYPSMTCHRHSRKALANAKTRGNVTSGIMNWTAEYTTLF